MTKRHMTRNAGAGRGGVAVCAEGATMDPFELRLFKMYKPAPDLRRADKSAAGTMPAAAFQYCEAMRTASAFGWYVYPPKDFSILFDGKELFHFDGSDWSPVKRLPFEDEFRDYWNANAAENLIGYDPPFLTELFAPGALQIWSGYFMRTTPNWSMLIRPPANYDVRSLVSPYEGLIETDVFAPCPLFINVRIVKTDVEVWFHKHRPLMQIQPIHRSCYASLDDRVVVEDAQPRDPIWSEAAITLRKADMPTLRPGRYAAATRKR